jgi:hypothetical protein
MFGGVDDNCPTIICFKWFGISMTSIHPVKSTAAWTKLRNALVDAATTARPDTVSRHAEKLKTPVNAPVQRTGNDARDYKRLVGHHPVPFDYVRAAHVELSHDNPSVTIGDVAEAVARALLAGGSGQEQSLTAAIEQVSHLLSAVDWRSPSSIATFLQQQRITLLPIIRCAHQPGQSSRLTGAVSVLAALMHDNQTSVLAGTAADDCAADSACPRTQQLPQLQARPPVAAARVLDVYTLPGKARRSRIT